MLVLVFIFDKYPRLINAENSREARCVYLRLRIASSCFILNAIEGEFATEEFEEFICCFFWYVRLEMQEVKVWLVFLFAGCSGWCCVF
jgi:hypothetical protein